jgi:hypothetical protein
LTQEVFSSLLVNEAIYGGERHRLIWKNSAPFVEGLICRDEQRALCTKTPGTTAALVS